MKAILLIFSVLLTFQTPLLAEEGGDRPVYLQDQSRFELEEDLVEMAVAEAEEDNEHIIIRTRRGAEFEFSLKPQSGYHSKSYKQMSFADQTQFQKMRILFLKKVATTIDRAEFALGIGNLIRENLYFIRSYGVSPILRDWKQKRRNPIDQLAEDSLSPEERTPFILLRKN